MRNRIAHCCGISLTGFYFNWYIRFLWNSTLHLATDDIILHKSMNSTMDDGHGHLKAK